MTPISCGEHRASTRNMTDPGDYMPKCEEDGSYSPLQCWGETGVCWCSDGTGVEIRGTRVDTRTEGTPDCSKFGKKFGTFFFLFDAGLLLILMNNVLACFPLPSGISLSSYLCSHHCLD